MVRMLLVAPTCDGDDVGEAWVAYQWAHRLAESHDVTLLTYHKRRGRPASEQLSGLRIVEWEEPAILGRFERLNSMLKPAYVPFYVRSRQWLKRALAEGESWDVAFQPTPVAARYPSPAAGLGLPLVLGPVGGGLDDPPGFTDELDTAPWFVRLRAVDQLRLRHDRLLRRNFAGADCVLGIAPYVREILAQVPLRRFETLSETALAVLPEWAGPKTWSPSTGPMRLLFVGRVVPTKGARYAVQALARSRAADAVLDIVGDGPDRAHCVDLAEKLRIADRVTFHGAVPRTEVDQFYRKAHVFLYPSYREPGGNVALEAMGHGLPLVVCDRGGPAAAVDETCAIRVPVTTPEALVTELAAAIDHLWSHPRLISAMGEAGRRHVGATGLWAHRVHRLNEIVAEIAGDRAEAGAA